MSGPIVIFDVSCLAYRAFHTFPNLSNGVLFGVFRDIQTLLELFGSDYPVFTFDVGRGLRELDRPAYKSTRREKRKQATDLEKELHRDLHRQLDLLREDYLPRLGYRNVFYQKGYEADDIIASVVQSQPLDQEIVMVSSDRDLYQLLNKNVIQYNPHQKKVTTLASFQKRYSVSAIQWVDVKAIAGCATDDVEGLAGIGEKTACKFLNGTLKPGGKAFLTIVHGNSVWKKNRILVKLPYPGTETFKLRPNRASDLRWRSMMHELGMESLVEQAAGSGRAERVKPRSRKRRGFDHGM